MTFQKNAAAACDHGAENPSAKAGIPANDTNALDPRSCPPCLIPYDAFSPAHLRLLYDFNGIAEKVLDGFHVDFLRVYLCAMQHLISISTDFWPMDPG